jgi:hypothetical protein
MSGVCCDCKYWGRPTIGGTWLKEWGACFQIESGFTSDDGRAVILTNGTIMLGGWDPADAEGELHTAPDFGCMLFEAKR